MIKMSPYSQVFCNEWKLNGERSDYNLVFDQALFGHIDPARLEHATRALVKDILLFHCCLRHDDDQWYWHEISDASFQLDYYDQPVAEADLQAYVKKPFHLEQDFLLRCALVKLADDHFRFIVVVHHLLMDGSKVVPFIDYLSHYYNDAHYHIDIGIEEQRQRLIALQAQLAQTLAENATNNRDFWQQKLAGSSGIDLRFLKAKRDSSDEADCGNDVAQQLFQFDTEVLPQLKKLQHQYRITPYLFGQIVFAILLHRYTDQDRLDFSYSIAIGAGAHLLCGAHINTNIISYTFEPSTCLSDVLANLKQSLRDTKANGNVGYPIHNIMQLAEGNHVLDVNFIQTDFRDVKFQFAGVDRVEIHTDLYVDVSSKLCFEQEIKNSVLSYRVRWNKKNIDQTLLGNFIEAFKKIFIDILTDLLNDQADTLVADYDILLAKDKKWLIDYSQLIDKPYPADKTVHQLFEEQVVKTPDSLALICGDSQLSYRELNEQANRLARYLHRCHAIQPDDLVVLFLDGNQSMVVAILAVLKAGAAYVPLDPSFPEERLAYMLSDAQAKLLLTHAHHCHTIERQQANCPATGVIAIDSDEVSRQLKVEQSSNLELAVQPEHLAYVIYTSGTTGKSKGVMVEHRNLVSFISHFVAYPLDADASFHTLSTTNYVFDIFALEYLLPLLNGYRCELVDITDVHQTLNLFACDCIQVTPSKLELLIDRIDYQVSHDQPHQVTILVGGEPFNPLILKKLQQLEKDLLKHKQPVQFTIINVYGPTETTIWSTAAKVDRHGNCYNVPVSIGNALYNETVYVLDRQQKLLPIGAVGELCIGGDGVTRGYLNQPQLTQQRFIDNPFQTLDQKKHHRNAKLYRTGDLARIDEGGNLEYIGRNDFQVKIRGHRVELSDIETHLAKYPGVKQAVVMLRENKEGGSSSKYLAAYYLAETALETTSLRGYLSARLPEYMLPNAFVHLLKWPITINGKLDRQALPDPVHLTESLFVEARNPPEKIICAAFAKVLALSKVGIDDDFFNLGGNSIKAISLVSTLKKDFAIHTNDIFKFKTARALASHILFGQNHLKPTLEKIKSYYQQPHKTEAINASQKAALARYKEKRICQTIWPKSPIKSVLLTGVTGFLGCNLLSQLLLSTDYRIYLLVRAPSTGQAIARVEQKFRFYFGRELTDSEKARLCILAADIERCDLGVSQADYQLLTTHIDSIIHAAALTKHYGPYDVFHSANVQATQHLLNVAVLTRAKEFHYISTTSVLTEADQSDLGDCLFTEDYQLPACDLHDNVYVKTKFEAEQLALAYRREGLKVNIYRVGNLAFMLSNLGVQQNIDDNAFVHRMKCLLKLKVASDAIGIEEISPVDLAAEAIVKLFDKKDLKNETYHIINPNVCNVVEFFRLNPHLMIKVLSISEFIDNIILGLTQQDSQEIVERFLLHQGWLEQKLQDTKRYPVLQDKTQAILTQLGFRWPTISMEIFSAFLHKACLDTPHT